MNTRNRSEIDYDALCASLTRRFGGDPSYMGEEVCKDLAYRLHSEGVYDAEEYRRVMYQIARFFGAPAPKHLDKIRPARRFAVLGRDLEVLSVKLDKLARKMESERERFADQITPNLDVVITTEIGKVNMSVGDEFTEQGEVRSTDFTFNFTLETKITRRVSGRL